MQRLEYIKEILEKDFPGEKLIIEFVDSLDAADVEQLQKETTITLYGLSDLPYKKYDEMFVLGAKLRKVKKDGVLVYDVVYYDQAKNYMSGKLVEKIYKHVEEPDQYVTGIGRTEEIAAARMAAADAQFRYEEGF